MIRPALSGSVTRPANSRLTGWWRILLGSRKTPDSPRLQNITAGLVRRVATGGEKEFVMPD